MSSNLASLVRLGICRGWRVKFGSSRLTYSVSILHCLFIYLILRAKAAKLGLWVVSYFILCTLKKYIIHVFFWRLPGRKKSRMFGGWSVKVNPVVVRGRKRIHAMEFQRFRFSIKPTKFAWDSMSRQNRESTVSSSTLGGLFPWARSRSMLLFWWNKYYKFPLSTLLGGFYKEPYGLNRFTTKYSKT